MSLKNILSKLTQEEKNTILEELIILPTIEDDHSLSKEEFGNIIRAGSKMEYSEDEIIATVHQQAYKIGATIEK